MPTIDYYISLNSPWTYLGRARFAAIAKKHDCTANVKPAKFSEVFAKTGGLPLLRRAPERRAYRLMDLKRWRDHLGIPINIEPKYFPSDEALQGKDAHRLATEIGKALWEMEQSIADPAALAAAAERAGLDAEAIRKTGPSDAELDGMHDELTAEAIKRGVFGAPSYVLPSGEIFWGQDRLEFLDRALARQDLRRISRDVVPFSAVEEPTFLDLQRTDTSALSLYEGLGFKVRREFLVRAGDKKS